MFHAVPMMHGRDAFIFVQQFVSAENYAGFSCTWYEFALLVSHMLLNKMVLCRFYIVIRVFLILARSMFMCQYSESALTCLV